MNEDHDKNQNSKSLDGLLKLIAKTIADKITEEQKEVFLSSKDSKGASDTPASASVSEKGKKEPRKHSSEDDQTSNQ